MREQKKQNMTIRVKEKEEAAEIGPLVKDRDLSW